MSSLRRVLPLNRKLRVCIIGAGASGLRCAARLLQHRDRIEVTVLEARNRVGGRIAQGSVSGRSVDLGPNWIHGTVNNPILDIAKKTGTVLLDDVGDQVSFEEDGSRVQDKETVEAATGFWDLVGEAFQYSREQRNLIPPTTSLLDFIKTGATKKYASLPAPLAARASHLLLHEAAIWGLFVGGTTSEQSLRFLRLEGGMEEESPFVAGTYANILSVIAAPAVEAGVVRLDTEVVRIVSRDVADEEEAAVEVELRGGASEMYDEVVVTSPMGWLKTNHARVFEPSLPARLLKAIENIGYGNLDKVYIAFPTAFWDGPGSCSPHPIFTNWHSHSDPRHAMSFSALPPPTSHPTLLFYISGLSATYISQLCALPPTERDDALIAHFAPSFSLLPNYDAANPSCVPSGVLATNWTGDEWAGYGSYSNFPVGLQAGDEDLEVLRAGVAGRRVWFAGEHVAPAEHLGTVTGAWLSGDAVSSSLLTAYDIGRTTRPQETSSLLDRAPMI